MADGCDENFKLVPFAWFWSSIGLAHPLNMCILLSATNLYTLTDFIELIHTSTVNGKF